MIQNPITELTKEVFQQAYGNPNSDVNGFVQFLRFSNSENGGDRRLFAILSNGSHHANVLINYNCERRFLNAIQPLDILNIDLRLIQERDYEQLCVQNFYLAHDNVQRPIGQTILFIPHVRMNGLPAVNNQQIDRRLIADHVNQVPEPENQIRNINNLNQIIQNSMQRGADNIRQLRARIANGHEPRDERNGIREVNQAPQRNINQAQRLPNLLPPDLAPRREAALAHIDIPRPDELIRENREEGNRRAALQPREVPRAVPQAQQLRDNDDHLRRRVEQEDVDDNYNKIADLVDNDRSWILKAKVTHKSDLNPLANGRGESFRISITDNTGSINCKFFYQAASQFYHLIDVGRVYEFQDGVVHASAYQSRVRSPYEIVFTNHPIITPVEGEDLDGQGQAQLLDIADILNQPEFTEVSVLAVVKDPGNSRVLNLRNGLQRAHLSVTMVDFSEREIKVCFWGDAAERIRLDQGEIYLLKNLIIKSYRGSLYLEWQQSSRIFCDDFQMPQYQELITWRKNHFQDYLNANDIIEVPFISKDTAPRPYVTLAELKQRSQDYFRQPENRDGRLFFDTTAFINNISWKTWYKACRRCMRSMFEEQEGNYYCKGCQTISIDYLTRFKAEIQMVDGTSWFTATAFSEPNCAILFQKTSVELERLERNDREAYRRLLRSKENIEMSFTICAKINNYRGQDTIGYTIMTCISADVAARQLIPRVRDRLGNNN